MQAAATFGPLAAFATAFAAKSRSKTKGDKHEFFTP
jgi:hypothetical protein